MRENVCAKKKKGIKMSFKKTVMANTLKLKFSIYNKTFVAETTRFSRDSTEWARLNKGAVQNRASLSKIHFLYI